VNLVLWPIDEASRNANGLCWSIQVMAEMMTMRISTAVAGAYFHFLGQRMKIEGK
jgi:hypothetical protein